MRRPRSGRTLRSGRAGRRAASARAHSNKRGVLAGLVDRVLDAEPRTADRDDLREMILVDQRDARLRASVAGHEPDEPRDEQRIGDQHAEQERRAYEHAQVLAEDERRAPQVKISSAWSSRYSAVGPRNVSSPRCNTATRSA